jgi:hypothetical protein
MTALFHASQPSVASLRCDIEVANQIEKLQTELVALLRGKEYCPVSAARCKPKAGAEVRSQDPEVAKRGLTSLIWP